MAALAARAATGIILALETSSAIATLVLARAGELAERSVPEPRAQTERLLPLINELLTEARLGVGDLDAIVFGRGPGSFTGLRVAAAVAQGLSLASGTPIVAVSSLAALAEQARRNFNAERVLTCVDARMGEVYWAEYVAESAAGRSPMQLVGDERLGPPEAVQVPAQGRWFAAGSGWERYAERLTPLIDQADGQDPTLYPLARDLLPQAASNVAAGRVLSVEDALPVYLRTEQAWHR